MIKNKTRNWHIFFNLTKRHLLVFFKNKIRVMFTLSVPVIIFVVYLFFLRDLELQIIKNSLNDYVINGVLSAETVKDPLIIKYIKTLIDSWMLSGILAISAITVALQTNNIFVEDKQNGVNRDFTASPIYKNLLITSYFLYNFIISVLICLVFLFICFIYLAIAGEFVLTFANVLTIIAVILFTTLASTLMTIFICSFVKSEGTMMGIVAIFSTAIGFLIGAYMPLGMMPQLIRSFCGFIPGTYSCSLLRYAFLETPLTQLIDYAATVGIKKELISELMGAFGYDLYFFGITVSPQWQSLALSVFIVLFLALNVGVARRLAEVLGIVKKQRKTNKHKKI